MARKRAKRLLDLRGNKWWFKRAIPAAVRGAFGGRTDYLVNLETGDLRLAMLRRDGLERDTDRMFADARAGLPVRVADEHDEIGRLAQTWAKELQAALSDPEGWHQQATGHEPSENEYGFVHVLSPADVLEGEVERIARAHGAAAAARFTNIVHGRVDVDHYLEDYLKEAGLAKQTTGERRGLVKRFATWALEQGLGVVDIGRPQAGRYVTANLVPMNRRTAGKHLTALTRYWGYLKSRGYVAGENPWKEQLLPENKRRVERGDLDGDEREFTKEEMRTLLYPAPPTKRGLAKWQLMQDAMRIAALSGMRQAEIITLWASDVKFEGDRPVIFDLQQGKNPNAPRPVPIHSDLVEIVERRLKGKSGNDPLFPELAGSKDPADTFGKRFATYRTALGVDDPREGKRRSLVNFHSFRRWFVTEAERADQPLSIIARVVGHEEGRKSMTAGYSGGTSLEQNRRCVEAVALPARED